MYGNARKSPTAFEVNRVSDVRPDSKWRRTYDEVADGRNSISPLDVCYSAARRPHRLRLTNSSPGWPSNQRHSNRQTSPRFHFSHKSICTLVGATASSTSCWRNEWNRRCRNDVQCSGCNVTQGRTSLTAVFQENSVSWPRVNHVRNEMLGGTSILCHKFTTVRVPDMTNYGTVHVISATARVYLSGTPSNR